VLLLLQNSVLVLVFKHRLYLNLASSLGSLTSFFSVFQRQLLSQPLTHWGVTVWVCILSSGSKEQLCSPSIILFWSWVFAVLIYWGLFLSLAPFLWCKVSYLSASSLLSACYDGLLIFFQFCSIVWLWMFLTCSDEFCGLLPSLFQASAYHLPTVKDWQDQSFFTKSLPRDQLLALPPFSSVLTAPCSLCCMFLFSSLFIVHFFLSFFFLWGRGSDCPGGYTCLSQG
jgi:hypothetical protein